MLLIIQQHISIIYGLLFFPNWMKVLHYLLSVSGTTNFAVNTSSNAFADGTLTATGNTLEGGTWFVTGSSTLTNPLTINYPDKVNTAGTTLQGYFFIVSSQVTNTIYQNYLRIGAGNTCCNDLLYGLRLRQD